MANWTDIMATIEFSNMFELKHYLQEHWKGNSEYNIYNYETTLDDNTFHISGEGRWETNRNELVCDAQQFNPTRIHIVESEPGNDFFTEYEEVNGDIICDYSTTYFSPESIAHYGLDFFMYLFEDYTSPLDIPDYYAEPLCKAGYSLMDVIHT